MLVDLDFYFDYFASLVGRDDAVTATGDLTPDYAMLSAERMRSIQASFDQRGLRTVAVFLMRDPVERVWSHIRMKADRHPDWFDRSTQDELLAEHAAPSYALRTRYHETLTTLGEAFDASQAHVGLSETLFTDAQQTAAVSDLVGITPRKPRLQVTSNSAPREVDRLPESIARPVAEHYAETYREVARLRPELEIPPVVAAQSLGALTLRRACAARCWWCGRRPARPARRRAPARARRPGRSPSRHAPRRPRDGSGRGAARRRRHGVRRAREPARPRAPRAWRPPRRPRRPTGSSRRVIVASWRARRPLVSATYSACSAVRVSVRAA